MFCEFGAGIYSGFVLVTCMQSGHVDSTYIVTDCLLEVHKSLRIFLVSLVFCNSIKNRVSRHHRLCDVKVGKVRRCGGQILFAEVASLCTASNWHFGRVWD
jgi:hypothetical protein